MEAQDSLGLDSEMSVLWEEMESHIQKQKSLKKELEELKDSKAAQGEAMAEADEQLETWETLRDDVDAGLTVFAPIVTAKSSSKKRKASSLQRQRKKQRRSTVSDDDEDDDYQDDASESSTEDESGIANEQSQGEPLTEEQVVAKITGFRTTKKEARMLRIELEEKMKAIRVEIDKAENEEKKIESEVSAKCISGRNEYSKGAIQQDFAAGIKELDQELAAEEDEATFDPDTEVRDYDQVARSLPVFCVSSRGYQKLQGRLRKDAAVPGFKSIEETGIPQLQAHCKKLTEAGRSENCRRFINNLSQLLNSLALWTSSDGTGANMTEEQKAKEARSLQGQLKKLESVSPGSPYELYDILAFA